MRTKDLGVDIPTANGTSMGLCYHCGSALERETVSFLEHDFCCVGCKTVYELLSEYQLCDYYQLNQLPGVKTKEYADKYNYLDDQGIQQRLLQFKDDDTSVVILYIPHIHCSSCIWLLENLNKIHHEVLRAKVDFIQKTVTITWKYQTCTLRNLVETLAKIGYEPTIALNDTVPNERKQDRSILYKIGVAGFCFGNMMLLSFPEYLGIDTSNDSGLKQLFAYLNAALGIPVIAYPAWGYISAAYKSVRRKLITIDLPLALGFIVLFTRSYIEIFTHTGAGYMDTLAGLAFFLLLGKWFQTRTFDHLNFERDYKSYFPIAVLVKDGDVYISRQVTELEINHQIRVRNAELIPADSILLNGDARIDYSFVTGESTPKKVATGEIIYAGGKQIGEPIELCVVKPVSQSYLTSLWNDAIWSKEGEVKFQTFQATISRYFTIALLFIAAASGLFWLQTSATIALNAFTAVLIIGCPCALALSSPFALGNGLRILGRNKFYIKNTAAIESLAKVDAIVFDKTGTITENNQVDLQFVGDHSVYINTMAASLAACSTHPLSQTIAASFEQKYKTNLFKETPGHGIEGLIEGKAVKLGAFDFVTNAPHAASEGAMNETRVYISIADEVKGYFLIKNKYRADIHKAIKELGIHNQLYLLSGDQEGERMNLKEIYPHWSGIYFNQTPHHKLEFIQKLKQQRKHTVMLGDGLNDAGALKQADVGISITEHIGSFTPASDVIMDAEALPNLSRFIAYSKNCMKVIYISFFISLVYNIVGLSVAVQGELSPLLAAILMPLSSITVIAFTTFATGFIAKKMKL
jgi:Cu+-exporting ATPase